MISNSDQELKALVTRIEKMEDEKSQIALDITLLAQRHGWDAQETMATLLGDRVGRLDSLLGRGETPALGTVHGVTRPTPPGKRR